MDDITLSEFLKEEKTRDIRIDYQNEQIIKKQEEEKQ